MFLVLDGRFGDNQPTSAILGAVKAPVKCLLSLTNYSIVSSDNNDNLYQLLQEVSKEHWLNTRTQG